MATTPKIVYYLTRGDTGIVLPRLYDTYKRKSYTLTHAKENVEGFNLGIHHRLHHLNIIEKAPHEEFIPSDPQRWRITEQACIGIERYIRGERNERRRSPYIPMAERGNKWNPEGGLNVSQSTY